MRWSKTLQNYNGTKNNVGEVTFNIKLVKRVNY